LTLGFLQRRFSSARNGCLGERRQRSNADPGNWQLDFPSALEPPLAAASVRKKSGLCVSLKPDPVALKIESKNLTAKKGLNKIVDQSVYLM
jgi:hypothetical protein